VARASAHGARLAVFDLDGTLTRHDTLLPYVLGYLRRHPWRIVRLPAMLIPAVRFLFDFDRGAIKGSFIHVTLGGAPRSSLQRWSEQFVRRLLQRGLHIEAHPTLERHRRAGDRLLLMSASTDLYVPQISSALGFDEFICTQLRWRADERLDGRLASANCQGEEKRRRLAEVLERDAPSAVSAYGNTRGDLPHMRLAQAAYLINGGPFVRTETSAVQRLRWH
jgi:phosphatidylglycerophosphatase C